MVLILPLLTDLMALLVMLILVHFLTLPINVLPSNIVMMKIKDLCSVNVAAVVIHMINNPHLTEVLIQN